MVMLRQTKRVVKILTENLQIFKRNQHIKDLEFYMKILWRPRQVCGLALYDMNQRKKYPSAVNIFDPLLSFNFIKITLYLINNFQQKYFCCKMNNVLLKICKLR